RSTLRFQAEQQRIEEWLQRISSHATSHPALALEITRAQRLVKGYGDTHQRGLRNFATLMGVLDQYPDRISPDMLHALRDAALADKHGKKLDETRQSYALV